jgi:dTDP-L-rhamnose 4-epimerase
MTMRVLITGGGGFIGSHVADELVEHGYRVRALDGLHHQVHGANPRRPAYLHREVELAAGDVRDPDAVSAALQGVDAVFHFAARVGVGQSMYQVKEYTDVNNIGTAILLEQLSKKRVERLIVASSMSIYGEGSYRDRRGHLREGVARSMESLRLGRWEPADEEGYALEPVPTPETKRASLSSIYALSKYVQEQMCLILGRAYGIPAVALRFFNVYGTRQALSNPYTGVLAIFASRLLNGNRPMIFEDGAQRRDFVNVKDVAVACRLALEAPNAVGRVFNIGSGRAHSVREIAALTASALGRPEIEPEVTQKYRAGDIRHCFADISLARRVLGFEPQIELAAGLVELADWLKGQVAVDRVADAREELSAHGLTF